MKFTINIEKADLELMIHHLSTAKASLAPEREKLDKIIAAIRFAYSLDELILIKVKAFLKSTTTAQVNLDSDLKFGLGITASWLKNSLYNYCNSTVTELISEAGTKLTFKAITKSAAAECKTVEDIVKLIKKTYESAA